MIDAQIGVLAALGWIVAAILATILALLIGVTESAFVSQNPPLSIVEACAIIARLGW